ncbi:hypothetical protein ACJ73_05883 [Blastomyces percursus]|uniref:Uncharacterized protein n=1 Tax=Blastomyces percursus TaxID=1658174 RepID=A0A1J9QRD1_9EURO|nr:hypothetical protein ACJ73_05883 [Blastomyces percursus]
MGINKEDQYMLTWTGDFVKESTVVDTPVHRRGDSLLSMFMCRFEDMAVLPTSGMGTDWYLSTIPNENNIRMVYFASPHNGVGHLAANLEPCIPTNSEAIECRLLTKNKSVLGDREWSIPLMRYSHISNSEPMVAWYDVNKKKSGRASLDETMSWPVWRKENKAVVTLVSNFTFMHMAGYAFEFTIPITNFDE